MSYKLKSTLNVSDSEDTKILRAIFITLLSLLLKLTEEVWRYNTLRVFSLLSNKPSNVKREAYKR